MSKVLIGVGGSGQHIVHAYLRMLALGNAGATEVPHVFIIDADALETEENDSKLIPDIKEVHAYLNQRTNDSHAVASFFDIIRPYNQGLGNDSTLSVQSVLTATQENTSTELSAFFYQSDLDIKVSEGMHANPKVGSTIFGEKLGQVLNSDGTLNKTHPKLSKEFSSLFDKNVTGQNANNVKIVIVGSVFGGTGSGIIPTLARTFNDILADSSNIEISTVTTLPWFNLVGTEDGSARDKDKLKRNTTFALKNFNHQLQSQTKNAVKSVLIQSGADWAEINRESAGDYDQPEHCHVINIKAANAVLHCFLSNFEPNKMYIPQSDLRDEVTLGQYHSKESRFLLFANYQQKESATLWNLLVTNLLTTMVLQALETILQSYHKGNFKHPYISQTSEFSGVSSLLKKISSEFKIELDNESSIFSKKEYVTQSVVDELKTSLEEEREKYQATLNWLYQHNCPDPDSPGIITDFQRYATMMNFNNEEHINARLSELLEHTDDTDIKMNEHWVSCSLKILNQSLFEQNGNLNSELEEKLKKVADAEDYNSLAMSIASLLFASMQNYVRSVPRIDLSKLGGYREIGQVYLQATNQKNIKDGVISHFGTIEWADQLTGDYANIDEMDIRHPRTLYWLDALRKVKVTDANEVDRRGIKVDETIAQGVPNILSSFLIQQWRIKAGEVTPTSINDKIVKTTADGIYQIHDGKEFHSTPYGLYLYAQRVNEAAFWLLIKGQSGVKYQSMSLKSDDAYKSWLQREQLSQGWLSDSIGMIVLDNDVQTPLFLWNGYFWCLAANDEAQAYFSNMLTSDTEKLPSIRYQYHTEDIFTRSERPDGRVIDRKERFFIDRLTALEELLQKRASKESQKVKHQERILHTLLKGILTDLPAATNDNNSVAKLAEPFYMGSQNPINLSCESSKVEADKQYNIIGQANEKNLSKYLIPNPRVIMLDKQPDEVDPILQIGQFLPITKEYWSDHPDIMETMLADKTSSLHTQLKFPDDSYDGIIEHTNLYNDSANCWQKFEIYTKQPILTLNANDFSFALGVWPDFQADSWNYYMLTADIMKVSYVFNPLTSPKLKAQLGNDELMLKVYSQDTKTFESFGLDAIPRKINFVPAIVELCCGDTVIGTQPITLRKLSGDGTVNSIGLDFGTSNTCMAVSRIDDRGKLSYANINLANTENQPLQEQVIYSRAESDGIRINSWYKNRAGFYLQRQANVSDDYSFNIPSELIVSLSLRMQDESDLDQDEKQYEHLTRIADSGKAINGIEIRSPTFTPLPTSFKGTEGIIEYLAILKGIVTKLHFQRLYSNIKWPNSSLGSESNSSKKLRETYIEQIIVAALARLRDEGVTKINYFYATRPDAFLFEHTTFAENYKTDLTTLLQELVLQTGVKFETTEAIEVSETEAALTLAHKVENEYSYVVVDIGGGTTDIDIYLQYIDTEGNIQAEKYTSSIRWAGNDLISAMLTKGCEIHEIYSDYLSEEDNLLLESMLKYRIRNNDRIIDATAVNPEPISAVAQMFFESIYEYIFIKIKLLLHAKGMESINCLEEQLMSIVLQGNGFKLSEYFSHANYPHKGLDNEDKHFAQSVWSVVFPDSNIELVVSYGEQSKEQMIAQGAGPVAEDIYQSNDKVTLAKPKLIYPAQIFDEQDELPRVLEYTNTMASPKLSETYRKGRNIQKVLTELFPYTSRYWQGEESLVARLFTQRTRGGACFHDINAMYLKGAGTGGDSWTFYMAMVKHLVGDADDNQS